MLKLPLVLVFLSLVTACSDGNDNGSGVASPFEGYTSNIYSDAGNWLCHPDLSGSDNVCASNLDTTLVFADGTTQIEEHSVATDPEVDCFYVYPTASADAGGNSDLQEGPEEIFAALNQAARYSRFCRVFAPVYRQGTLNGIIAGVEGDRELAYGDVLDSFKHYIANSSNGRGFILIGHSQGSGHLRRLIEESIETDDYLMQHMIAAHLLGSTMRSSEGTDIIDGLRQVGICRTNDQTGCIISYVSYRENDAFVSAGTGLFGTPKEGATAVCTHPAALSGGSAELDAYFPLENIPLIGEFIIQRADGPFANPEQAPPITTPFYKMPGFLSGECVVDQSGISYLKVSVNADPADPRADDFNGEMILQDWGLHLVDVTIGMGDLVRLGTSQAQAWLQDRD